jgi:hypothetical protein
MWQRGRSLQAQFFSYDKLKHIANACLYRTHLHQLIMHRIQHIVVALREMFYFATRPTEQTQAQMTMLFKLNYSPQE